MKILISSGHGKYAAGAAGVIDEVTEARKVVSQVVSHLKSVGEDVIEYHENTATNKTDNLNAIVKYHNSQSRDLDVSVHFNAYSKTDNPVGVEVLYYSESALAAKVSKAIADVSGLKNRGAKERKDLYFLNGTTKPAILIEVCFVDSTADVKFYQAKFDAICRAITEAISRKPITDSGGVASGSTPIIGPATATITRMKAWAENKKAATFFIDLVGTFFNVAVAAGINPVAVYTQSAKETAYGRFSGVLDASYCNPCGLKINEGGNCSDPNAHKKFASWAEGIQAQVDHLALYAGAAGYPKADTPDPRHFPYLKGTVVTVESLGGKWTPSATYGEEIVKMMRELEAVKVEEPKHEAARAAIDLICEKCGFVSPDYWKGLLKDVPYFPEFVTGIASKLS